MTVTVEKLIEILSHFPSDAEIDVVETTDHGYMGQSANFISLEINESKEEWAEGKLERFDSDLFEVMDCRDNSLMKDEDRKVYIQFGST